MGFEMIMVIRLRLLLGIGDATFHSIVVGAGTLASSMVSVLKEKN